MISQISPMIGVFQTYKGSNSIMDMHRILIENIQLLKDWSIKRGLEASQNTWRA